MRTRLTIAHHSSKAWVTFLGHGYLAVSLFFILSGFILTYNYAERWHPGSFSSFLLARFAQIYPVYLLALLLELPHYWPHMQVRQVFAVLCMVQSWTVLPSTFPGAWNFPAWTLSVEWFFYLIFPCLLAGISRIQNKRIAIALACLTSVAVGGTQAAIGGRVSWLMAHVPLPLLRLPEFVLGMLLARYVPKQILQTRRWMGITLITIALLLVLDLHRFVTLIVIPFAALLWLLAFGKSRTRRLLQTRVLTVLGGASYSIYLLQVPVLHWFADATRTYMHTIVYLFVLIAFSLLVFFVWEQPARRWIRNAAR